MDLDQYLTFLGSRLWYLFESKNIGRPVFGIDNRFHEYSPNLP
jgi:hypothetical protein